MVAEALHEAADQHHVDELLVRAREVFGLGELERLLVQVVVCSASERSPSTRSENGSTPVMSGSSWPCETIDRTSEAIVPRSCCSIGLPDACAPPRLTTSMLIAPPNTIVDVPPVSAAQMFGGAMSIDVVNLGGAHASGNPMEQQLHVVGNERELVRRRIHILGEAAVEAQVTMARDAHADFPCVFDAFADLHDLAGDVQTEDVRIAGGPARSAAWRCSSRRCTASPCSPHARRAMSTMCANTCTRTPSSTTARKTSMNVCAS